jgi:hypothetical protein
MAAMNEARLERLLGLVQGRQFDPSVSVPLRICRICPEALPVDGAGVSLIAEGMHQPIAASDQVAQDIEDMQVQTGEGPCVDAYSSCLTIIEPDLRGPQAQLRWPAFSSGARELGAGAVFGFPLVVNRVPIGALDLYSRNATSLSDSELDDALMLADMAALSLRTADGDDPLAVLNLGREPQQEWAHEAVVHHAAGMTAVQLGISVDQAMLRLRAHAFVAGCSLADTAGDVVARRLRIEAWNHD